MSSNFFVSKNLFLSNLYEPNQTAQILGQWAILSKSQLTILADSFGKQAADLSFRYSISIIATVATLTFAALSYLFTQYNENEQMKKYSYTISGGALLLFGVAASFWLDTYLKIPNANL